MNNLSTQKLQLGSSTITSSGGLLYINNLGIVSNNSYPFLSSGASLTLSSGSYYINNGTGIATWTMPTISSSVGIIYNIKNKGNTINLTGQGTDMFFSSQVVPSFQVFSGNGIILANDGYHWNIM